MQYKISYNQGKKTYLFDTYAKEGYFIGYVRMFSQLIIITRYEQCFDTFFLRLFNIHRSAIKYYRLIETFFIEHRMFFFFSFSMDIRMHIMKRQAFSLIFF